MHCSGYGYKQPSAPVCCRAQPESVQGADVSLHMRGGCDAGSVLRLLRPPLQLCTAILRVAAQLERRQRRAACSSWAAASSRALQHSGAVHVCKVRSSSSDLLFSLALLPVARPSTSRQMAVSVCDSLVQLCGCATLHHMRCGTASQLTMCRPAQARAAEQCQ